MHIQTTWTSRALSRTECRGRGPGEQTGLIALTASRSSGSKLAEAKHLPMLALCVDILRGSELKLSSLSTAQRCTCKKYRAQEQPLFDLFCRCWSITHSHAKMQKCENAEEGWRICGMWTIDCVVSAFRPRRGREFKRSTGHLPGNLGTPTKTSLSCMIQASASCIFNYLFCLLVPTHTNQRTHAPTILLPSPEFPVTMPLPVSITDLVDFNQRSFYGMSPTHALGLALFSASCFARC